MPINSEGAKSLFFQICSIISKSRIMMIILIIVFFKMIYLTGALVSIKPGYVGVVFDKFGETPKIEGRFIVEKGEKGCWREVLLPGWHFFWMCETLWRYNIDEYPMQLIRSQYIGVVEAMDGTPMPEGEIFSADDYIDEKGVFHMGGKGPRMTVLKPGLHAVNPKYLQVTEQPAVMIPEGKVGVVTRKTGKVPPEGMVLVSEAGKYRGVQKEIITQGTYYFNPLAVKVELVDVLIIKKGQLGVLTKNVGEMPPSGTILVSAGDKYQGIQREILQPGRYHINPYEKDVKVVDAVIIEKGQVGVVTKKVGDVPQAGTILVNADDKFQGIQREVLQPGMYYINPYEKDVKVVDAVIIPDGHVGVQVAKTGESKPSDQLLAKAGQRGILEETIPPGMYYINPFEYEIIIFDTREQRYEMTSVLLEGDTQGDDSIHFLSDDGFMIKFDLTILYQVPTRKTPHIVATVGRDIISVREKKIRPPARSFARIIGSKKKGEEFIHGITREEFQSDLHEALKAACAKSDIIVNQTLVRHFEVPDSLREPITKKVIALKLEDQYKQEQDTQKANAELSRQTQLVVFESEKVKAETIKIRAVIAAEQQRDEAEILMAQKKFEADGDAAKKRINADAQLYAAQKEVEGIEVKLMAEAKGQKAMIEAWGGKGASNFVASRLAEVMKGARLLPLETFFGGSGNGKENGNGAIRYHNTLDLLNFFNINKLLKDEKENPVQQ